MFDPTKIDLLIVDDDDDFRATLVRRFQRRGYQVQDASNGEAALKLLERRQFDIAVFDMIMPGLSGLELLEAVKSRQAECEILLLTGQGTIDTAVQAMKLGARDYLTKPFPLAELEILLQRAYEHRQLSRENLQLKAALQRTQSQWEMVGQSPQMQQVFALIERAGRSEKAILVEGESGTGKELVARALHRSSPRAERPLVTINCAALPEQLLESELFGHEKGSFTGATAAKPGLFELADQGTLFIDEIGEMPLAMQAKLLRVLEDGSMRRVGSLQERRVDVRLISATNRELSQEIKEGRFREDLYYRINVMTLHLPPLRERVSDIPLLVSKFLGAGWQIDQPAMDALQGYTWPGNIRQLINVLERAKILADHNYVQCEHLPPEVTNAPIAPLPISSPSSPPTSSPASAISDSAPPMSPQSGPAEPVGDDLSSVERAKIIEVLHRERGNKTRTARALGITRRTLYRLLEKYDISRANDS